MDDIDARLDTLFAGAPAGFTGARDALARELRAEGRVEDAERVRALRRPSKLAAEINRLVREAPDRVEALLGAEAELAEAQGRIVAGAGDADALRRAEAAESAALDAFPGDAAIRAALRFAARSEAERDDLRRGRLTRDPAAGDEAGGPFALGPAQPRATPAREGPPVDELAEARAARAARAADRDDDAQEERLRAAIAALEDARRAEQDALAARDRARRGADDAETAGAWLQAERERLRAEAKAADAAIAAHRPVAKAAAKARADAEAAATAATRARDAAERSARRLAEGSSD